MASLAARAAMPGQVLLCRGCASLLNEDRCTRYLASTIRVVAAKSPDVILHRYTPLGR
jgi:hypothetical protein